MRGRRPTSQLKCCLVFLCGVTLSGGIPLIRSSERKGWGHTGGKEEVYPRENPRLRKIWEVFFFEVENQKCFRLWKNEQMISRLEGVNPGEKAVADWWWGWSGEAPEGEDWRMKGKCNRRETQWKGGVMKGELNKKRSNK